MDFGLETQHSMRDCYGQENSDEAHDIAQQRLPVRGHDVLDEYSSERVYLVGGTHEDERDEDDVEDGVARYQHQ